MQLIFDNLIATMVAMALTVSLLSQQTRTRQESLERVSVFAAKTQSLAFAEWLEYDVVKLGARFGRSRNRFEATTETVDGVPFTTAFEFRYHKDAAANNVVTRVEVRYEIVPDADTRVVIEKGATPADDRTMPVYRLVRSVREGKYNLGQPATDPRPATLLTPAEPGKPAVAPYWVGGAPGFEVTEDHASPVGLRHFHIEPRDSDGNPVPDNRPEDADYVRVQFSVVPTMFPLHRARLVPKNGLHWATTVEIRPF